MLDGQSVQPWHPFGRVDVLPVVPGEAIHVPVEVFPTSAVIRPGHRLRVTISAYDVPHALPPIPAALGSLGGPVTRSEEHTSELQSLMRISYAVFCLKHKKNEKHT